MLLAAGRGSRFSGPRHKLNSLLEGRPLVEHALEAALLAELDATYLVVGAEPISAPPGVIIVRNPRWAEGLASSLTAAIAAARQDGHEAIVVALADQPRVTADAWRTVSDRSDVAAVFASYDGRRGHPVRLHRSVWDLVPASGDEGARRSLERAGVAIADVECSGSPFDVDTLADLAELDNPA
ncbi:MAG: nucleotidyltransferase family protein [Actinomycetota bacterium]|nr:nucleotidyltransferase family protein [Actinomycetota bacterium]